MTSVDALYQIVRVKTKSSDWVTPTPKDLVHFFGPVLGGNKYTSNDEATLESDGSKILCAGRVVWGDRLIYLECLYHPSTSLFTDVESWEDETVSAKDRADRVETVGVSMQNAVCRGEQTGRVLTADEDVRDDNGSSFLVIHVNKGLSGSTRLYCKRMMKRRGGLC